MGRDLEPRLASLLWSNTYADAIKVDLTIETNKGRHMFPFEKSFKILGNIFNPPENLGKVLKGVSLQHFRFRVRKMILRSAGFANT